MLQGSCKLTNVSITDKRLVFYETYSFLDFGDLNFLLIFLFLRFNAYLCNIEGYSLDLKH